jgi:hypothetical protein
MNWLGECAFNSTLAQPTGIKVISNANAHSPKVETKAIVAAAIDEA